MTAPDHVVEPLKTLLREWGIHTWHLDEVAIKIAGKKHWLWRAVEQDGIEVVLGSTLQLSAIALRIIDRPPTTEGKVDRMSSEPSAPQICDRPFCRVRPKRVALHVR